MNDEIFRFVYSLTYTAYVQYLLLNFRLKKLKYS